MNPATLPRDATGTLRTVTGERTRKGRNLAADPRCAIAASSQELPALDVVLEGEARKVTDEAVVRRVADAYGSAMHWPLEVRDGLVYGPNAPTAGPPPYAVRELRPAAVVGLPGIAGTEEGKGPVGGSTRGPRATQGGFAALADRYHRPAACPHQIAPSARA